MTYCNLHSGMTMVCGLTLGLYVASDSGHLSLKLIYTQYHDREFFDYFPIIHNKFSISMAPVGNEGVHVTDFLQ